MRLLGITIDEFRMIDDQWLPAGGLVSCSARIPPGRPLC